MQISIVIPLFDEDESLPELHDWIVKVMNDNQYTYEILFIDDGSKDNSWKVITELETKNANIKGIKFRRNYGKSAALHVAFERALGDVIITMDADLQDSPEEIPELYKMITVDGFDLVSGWKQKRYDPITKTIPTKLFNWATRKMSGIELNDFNCGLKAYKKDVIKSIEIYGEMHRYIPVIAKWAGFPKIGEKVVQHRERKYGTSKFGLERFVNGFLDLMTITFISKFGKRPMHFFGLIGTLMFMIGLFSAVYLGADKLWTIYHNERGRLITEKPAFYIALTTMIIGTILFVAGFLGELIGRNSSVRNHYLIERDML
jgi:glycosyltransferase involved in cell wall biosynthesis